jgi:hypothetical protein
VARAAGAGAAAAVVAAGAAAAAAEAVSAAAAPGLVEKAVAMRMKEAEWASAAAGGRAPRAAVRAGLTRMRR